MSDSNTAHRRLAAQAFYGTDWRQKASEFEVAWADGGELSERQSCGLTRKMLLRIAETIAAAEARVAEDCARQVLEVARSFERVSTTQGMADVEYYDGAADANIEGAKRLRSLAQKLGARNASSAEVGALLHVVWENSDRLFGDRASSHYRSKIADRVAALTGKAPKP